MLAITRSGRAALRSWLATPVVHLRDLRSELLLKLVLAERCDVDVRVMIAEQKRIVRAMIKSQGESSSGDVVTGGDVVTLWRREAAEAALRFLSHL